MSEETIPEISYIQFQQWKHNPVTKTVFAFLRAYKKQIENEHLERWTTGNLDPQLESRAVGVMLFTDTFLALEYEAIQAAFQTDTESEDGEQVNSDRTG